MLLFIVDNLLAIAIAIMGTDKGLDYRCDAVHLKQQWLAWCIFVAISGHCISFMGVSYFGQIRMLWYLMLAIVGYLAHCEIHKEDAICRPSLEFP